ncbi:hypothetical protein ACJBU6_05670 [Exserohilum turcicum]
MRTLPRGIGGCHETGMVRETRFYGTDSHRISYHHRHIVRTQSAGNPACLEPRSMALESYHKLLRDPHQSSMAYPAMYAKRPFSSLAPCSRTTCSCICSRPMASQSSYVRLLRMYSIPTNGYLTGTPCPADPGRSAQAICQTRQGVFHSRHQTGGKRGTAGGRVK